MWIAVGAGYDGSIAKGETVLRPLYALVEAMDDDAAWGLWRTRHALSFLWLSVHLDAKVAPGCRTVSNGRSRDGGPRVEMALSAKEMSALSGQARVLASRDILAALMDALPPEVRADMPVLPAVRHVWPACLEHRCFITFSYDYEARSPVPWCETGGHVATEGECGVDAGGVE